MPTRKQRRRRQKEQRHEYEFVTYDDEGQEIPVDSAELKLFSSGAVSTLLFLLQAVNIREAAAVAVRMHCMIFI